jgi:hypothetical protein
LHLVEHSKVFNTSLARTDYENSQVQSKQTFVGPILNLRFSEFERGCGADNQGKVADKLM